MAKVALGLMALIVVALLLLRPKPMPEFLSETSSPSRRPAGLTLSSETDKDPIIKLIPILGRERLGHLPPRQVVEALRLAKGMTVADIGAGNGVFTFEMARAVGEDGKVEATEIDPHMLKELAAKRDAQGFRNVEVKQVRRGAFDDFYRGKTYDRVLMSGVVEYLPDPEAFFAELRSCLKPNTGSVVLIHPRVLWKFQMESYYRYPAITTNLLQGGTANPAFRRLGPSLQSDLLRLQAVPKPPRPSEFSELYERHREAFTQAVNRMLEDPSFPIEMIEHASRTQPSGLADVTTRLREHTLVFRWLYYAHNDLFEPPREPRTEEERMAVRMINKTLVIPLILGEPYFPGWAFPRAVFLPKQGLAELMKRAGYQLVRSEDLFTYFAFLEFAPSLSAPPFSQPSERPPQIRTEKQSTQAKAPVSGGGVSACSSAEAIVKMFGLSPGENVLLLGSDDGSMAGAIAAAVGPRGSVRVADTRAPLLKQEPGTGTMAHITPVILGPDWQEDIGRPGEFDGVVLLDMLDRLPKRDEQLPLLLRSLRHPTGRMFVLRRDLLPPFDEDLKIDPQAVLKKLRQLGPQSPFYARLTPALQKAIASAAVVGDQQLAKQEVLSFLNRCLHDQRLHPEIARFYASKTQTGGEYFSEVSDWAEATLLCSLLHIYYRAFEPAAEPETPQQALAVHTVNHLLLSAIFSLPRQAPFYADDAPRCRDEIVPARLKNAGFEQARILKAPPHFTAWEFRPRKVDAR